MGMCVLNYVISLTSHLSADPELKQSGEQQARDARSAWETEQCFGVPVPERLYTSPLTRAIRTNQITFDDTMVSGLERTIVEVSLFIPCTYVLDALMLMRRCRTFTNNTVFILGMETGFSLSSSHKGAWHLEVLRSYE